MNILGIESSCDETGIAIYNDKKGIVANELYSQIALHAEYGGVVPELASRDHIRKIIPLLDKALKSANLAKTDIDAVAYTQGPGLAGALLVGASVGATLAFALGVPSIGVHHMEGHLLAPFLEEKQPKFPFVALLISGGHTQLVEVKALGDYHLLGETLDDACGEAFDKTAKLLGLDYPGGVKLSALAQFARSENIKTDLVFPCPMIDRPGFDFSFSGLKTFAANTISQFSQKSVAVNGALAKDEKAQIALAFETAVARTLYVKTKRALQHCKTNQLVVAGGVSANHTIRNSLSELTQSLGGDSYFARPEYCTDNGAMIAYAGFVRFSQQQQNSSHSFTIKPRWDMTELEQLG